MRWFCRRLRLRRLLVLVAGSGSAAGAGSDSRTPIRRDRRITDLPGGDIASIFDTTLEACERACLTNARCTAFTFNTRNGSCFPEGRPGRRAHSLQGAYVRPIVIEADRGRASAAARTRRAELAFLPDWDVQPRLDQAAGLGRPACDRAAGRAESICTPAAEAEAQGDLGWAGGLYRGGAEPDR